jgi:hypothetical protein
MYQTYIKNVVSFKGGDCEPSRFAAFLRRQSGTLRLPEEEAKRDASLT